MLWWGQIVVVARPAALRAERTGPFSGAKEVAAAATPPILAADPSRSMASEEVTGTVTGTRVSAQHRAGFLAGVLSGQQSGTGARMGWRLPRPVPIDPAGRSFTAKPKAVARGTAPLASGTCVVGAFQTNTPISSGRFLTPMPPTE